MPVVSTRMPNAQGTHTHGARIESRVVHTAHRHSHILAYLTNNVEHKPQQCEWEIAFERWNVCVRQTNDSEQYILILWFWLVLLLLQYMRSVVAGWRRALANSILLFIAHYNLMPYIYYATVCRYILQIHTFHIGPELSIWLAALYYTLYQPKVHISEVRTVLNTRFVLCFCCFGGEDGNNVDCHFRSPPEWRASHKINGKYIYIAVPNGKESTTTYVAPKCTEKEQMELNKNSILSYGHVRCVCVRGEALPFYVHLILLGPVYRFYMHFTFIIFPFYSRIAQCERGSYGPCVEWSGVAMNMNIILIWRKWEKFDFDSKEKRNWRNWTATG